jgi:predicted DNA-binding antitoxin AbrB/MazE fold protein
MTITVAAIYENGVLRPRQPLELAEGTEVRLTITAPLTEPAPAAKTVTALLTEIDRLAALEPNWDGYGGPALDRDILDAARRFVVTIAANTTTPPRVVPMSSGALQFEWHRGPKLLELEVEDPGSIHYLKWDASEDVQEEDIFPIGDTAKAAALIGWFTGAGSNV